MTDDRLVRLEQILERRARLWSQSIYFWGASERSPSFGSDDQTAWDLVLEELCQAEDLMAGLAQELRDTEPARFSAWVAGRRRLQEQRLAAPDVKDWERDHLRGTIDRWHRYLREDYSDFYRWHSW
jgi:hypothetical protein